MIVYQDYSTYLIVDTVINVISSETDYGLCMVGEINDEYHYLDTEVSELIAAVLLWQSINGRDLTNEEALQVIEDNRILAENEEQ